MIKKTNKILISRVLKTKILKKLYKKIAKLLKKNKYLIKKQLKIMFNLQKIYKLLAKKLIHLTKVIIKSKK